MGTNLVKIGNYDIAFGQREVTDLADDLAQRLNRLQFVNAEYLRLFALHWENSEPRRVRLIRQIKTKRDWTYIPEIQDYHIFEKDKCIEFTGPFNLSLTFYEHHIYFHNPPLRYLHWIGGEDASAFHLRNEWRKYMHQVVHAFGGNRVIYLADNAHPLDGFADMDVPFSEIEAALRAAFGEPATTFSELAEKPHSSYMIDHLNDIDWSATIPLDAYYPEPHDLTSTDHDLHDFATKVQLEQVHWHDETLAHRHVDGVVSFFHIARFGGVLVQHQGTVNGEETLKCSLDAYAPFTFDALKEKIKAAGYCPDLAQDYAIHFYRNSDYMAWQAALLQFEQKLSWTGNGRMGNSMFSNERSVWNFSAVDGSRAVELLLSLGKEHHSKAPIEIIKEGENETIIFKT